MLAESQELRQKLENENQDMHKKMAQAKGSIIVGDQSSSSSPNFQAQPRPDSSNLRMRIDDSRMDKSKSNLSSGVDPYSIHDQQQMRKLQISPNSDKIRPQDIDFTNLDESMSQNMQDAPKYEIMKLREENQELKAQMLRLK